MQRKTLPPFTTALLAFAVSAGCAGDPPVGRPPPEDCQDGIDNDSDGLVDCDDSAECGGLQCQNANDTDTGITVDLPDLEIEIPPDTCCNFTFSDPADCPMVVGSYVVHNRTLESEAELDASCDLYEGDSPISFDVEGCSNCPTPFLTNFVVDPQTSVTVELVFNCSIGHTFTANCLTDVKANGAIPAEVEKTLNPTGTYLE
jgi:hypothetical protein